MQLPGLNWTAPHDVFIGRVTEVDMASAGLSVIKSERLLPPATIARIEALPKAKQSVAIGMISTSREHKQLANVITAGIKLRVEAILDANRIDIDRVLSVKRDAVFVTGPQPSLLHLNDGTEFKIKSSYTSFVKLDTVEVYAVPTRGLADLKGIPKEKRPLHEAFITRLVLDTLALLEKNNAIEAAKILQQFRRDYVERRLPLGFYREFNSSSMFTVSVGNALFAIDGLGDDIKPDSVDITFNLRNVIIALAKAFA